MPPTRRDCVPGTPVVAGGGDGQCAGTGANLFGGRAYLNLGTAVVSGSFGKSYAHDPAFRTMTAVAKTAISTKPAFAPERSW